MVSEQDKARIVRKCCEGARCGIPNPGESAFEYVFQSYMEGINYAGGGENYPIEELVERQVPYNNYTVATIWTELQLYRNQVSDVYNININEKSFIEIFQIMLFVVTNFFILQGITDGKKTMDKIERMKFRNR